MPDGSRGKTACCWTCLLYTSLEQANTPSSYNDTLMQMVVEETAGFFEGSMSAGEAAKALSARTQAYLAE